MSIKVSRERDVWSTGPGADEVEEKGRDTERKCLVSHAPGPVKVSSLSISLSLFHKVYSAPLENKAAACIYKYNPFFTRGSRILFSF